MTDTNPAKLDAQALLDQILSMGRDLAAQGEGHVATATAKSKELAAKGENILVDKLGIDDSVEGRDGLRKGLGAGAAAGALALLLGSRSGRKLAVVGGLAGLGTLAYKAYQKNGGEMPASMAEAVGLLTGAKKSERSEILLRAMVAMAKADGTVDDREAVFINAHDGVDSDTLAAVMTQDPDAKEIAALSDSDQTALEIYAVSCRVADGFNHVERDYLDRLAMELRLDPELAARIETDVRTGS